MRTPRTDTEIGQSMSMRRAPVSSPPVETCRAAARHAARSQENRAGVPSIFTAVFAVLVLLASLSLMAPGVFAKGMWWTIEFEDDPQNEGEVRIKIDAERENGQIDEHYFTLWIEEPLPDRYWKASELRDQLNDSGGGCHFDATVQNGNTVRVEIDDDCPHYEDIEGVSVYDNSTGEGITITEDDPPPVYATRLTLNINGTGTGGWFKLGVAEEGYPLVEVSETAGMTGPEIEEMLVSLFNAAYIRFTASLEGDTLIVIEDVPCPYGAAFGTTDTSLAYLFSMTRTDEITNVAQDAALDLNLRLHPNVPNPFSPSTSIAYELTSHAYVTLNVYSVTGELVRTLADGIEDPGANRVVWDGRNDKGEQVDSGIYFFRLNAGGFEQVHKMVLLR